MKKQFCNFCDVILDAGRDRFGAMMGIVSHIHEGSYDVIAVSSETGIADARWHNKQPQSNVFCAQYWVAITAMPSFSSGLY